MAKSDVARMFDDFQKRMRPFFRHHRFRVRERTYNRRTEEGLTQVIQLQMGPFDPPGTPEVAGLRDNLYGQFTVGLGVYVPEAAQYMDYGEAGVFVREYDCQLRERLGHLGPEHADLWWEICTSDEAVRELEGRLERDGLPFLERLRTRDRIVEHCLDAVEREDSRFDGASRVLAGVILAVRGECDAARDLFAAEIQQADHHSGSAHTRAIAAKLGLDMFPRSA